MFTPPPISHLLRATGGGGRRSLIPCILGLGDQRKPSGKEIHLEVGPTCTEIVQAWGIWVGHIHLLP